ncbi:MAG: 2-C-methyl-D-erythritol 2,4-cyclodiphosphate synthase [Phycisphaerales bacterium]|jgi:2-C-methyl-D-erythritol 2,4-cyclodiphosphate synthase|nr:2-C-methyl-D-erythritol 2,4-cyclodiphosphate synthase [Phycisphaerales bacterium]MBT7171110.1 2-C-methyl-D-erythritol 2,4-cyclodiphosphate synthase [Phycisphaerales bacterium]
MNIRIGHGYDSHRFEGPGPLILGSLDIPHEQGFSAHSDGDVVLHAVTDAVLGALAAGDIGEHFPDTDPANKGQSSDAFLRHAMNLAAMRGFRVGNLDVTILAEVPKLSPHKQPMAEAIAELLCVDVSHVSIKAKTNERMGFVGRREGIAVMASVLMMGDVN